MLTFQGKNDNGIMLSVDMCFNFVSRAQFYKDLLFRVIVLESNYFAMWGFALRETEARDSGLSTNYKKEPCIFYYLVY